MDDDQVLDGLRLTVDQVARMFRVPKRLILGGAGRRRRIPLREPTRRPL